ncbi:MAG: DNA recombination protein RmuC [Verrucomicrobia bacterium]|nr:DNA recombination protein RmuC [Verrucomicrobiota bacterium]
MWIWGTAGVAAVGLWLWMREKGLRKEAELRFGFAQEQNQKIPLLEAALKEKEEECAFLNTQQIVSEEKIQLLQNAEEQLKSVFRALSADALEKNNRAFLDLAKTSLEKFQEGAKGDLEKRQIAITELLKPVNDTLVKLDTGIRQIEKERKGDQESLKEQVKSLLDNERQLKQETSNLVKALRTPLARGRWGEIQLRRVVEMAGMLNQCDFYEQQLGMGEEGRLRPDLIVRLPGGRQVIIDSKVPLEAYLEAVHAEDEAVRVQGFKNHARQVRSHVATLGKKAYWEHFQPTPEFVVLFLPAETFFSTALEFDPTLIEYGAEQNVILATPTTLIALLRAVSYGWRQENLTRRVETLHELGQDLYKRLGDMNSHFARMGRSLTGAVDAYNKGIGSLETRVLVTARKFRDLGISPGQVDIEEIELVEKITRELQSKEMQGSADE